MRSIKNQNLLNNNSKEYNLETHTRIYFFVLNIYIYLI